MTPNEERRLEALKLAVKASPGTGWSMELLIEVAGMFEKYVIGPGPTVKTKPELPPLSWH